jgi:hypothetical protein
VTPTLGQEYNTSITDSLSLSSVPMHIVVNPLVFVLSLEPLDHKEEDCSHDIRTPSKRNADLEDVRTCPVENVDRIRVQRKCNRPREQGYWSRGDPYYRE